MLMVWGKPNDPDGRPLNLGEAASAADVKPDVLRRWLNRPDFIAFLRGERRSMVAASCAGNPAALRRVRDTSQNPMAVVASVRTLQDIEAAEEVRAPVGSHTPGVTINIVNAGGYPSIANSGRTIATAYREIEPDEEPETERDLAFVRR